MYSIFCAVGAVFVVAYVPETKGRDLNSIAELFAAKEKSIHVKEHDSGESTTKL